MQLKTRSLNDIEMINDKRIVKKLKNSNNDTYMWHLHLGHININRIQRLVKEGFLGHLKVEPLLTYESCLEGKMTKPPFS